MEVFNMKTLLNTKNETITKFDDFNEMKTLLFDLLHDHLCCIFDNFSKLTYNDFDDIRNYTNDFDYVIKRIKNDSIELYLYDDNDNTYILYTNDYDDTDDMFVYDIYNNEFIDIHMCQLHFFNQSEMLSHIIDELNKQLLCNNVSRETHNN